MLQAEERGCRRRQRIASLLRKGLAVNGGLHRWVALIPRFPRETTLQTRFGHAFSQTFIWRKKIRLCKVGARLGNFQDSTSAGTFRRRFHEASSDFRLQAPSPYLAAFDSSLGYPGPTRSVVRVGYSMSFNTVVVPLHLADIDPSILTSLGGVGPYEPQHVSHAEAGARRSFIETWLAVSACRPAAGTTAPRNVGYILQLLVGGGGFQNSPASEECPALRFKPTSDADRRLGVGVVALHTNLGAPMPAMTKRLIRCCSLYAISVAYDSWCRDEGQYVLEWNGTEEQDRRVKATGADVHLPLAFYTIRHSEPKATVLPSLAIRLSSSQCEDRLSHVAEKVVHLATSSFAEGGLERRALGQGSCGEGRAYRFLPGARERLVLQDERKQFKLGQRGKRRASLRFEGRVGWPRRDDPALISTVENGGLEVWRRVMVIGDTLTL
ncbi:hypothetical protein IW261DRAFT_1412791 [Armillaria novae-zelandiae]|uniref:Uncharacterized protein n=1 Tax=Armillaria novae-zelandiae TaxID=153914 RepID=A0AA39PTP1_9AGAR|nr:hypothetical protein IW261DRAFT_1412791 [Armillaria novae-zelandiae]